MSSNESSLDFAKDSRNSYEKFYQLYIYIL